MPGTSATILGAGLDVGVELAGDDARHVEGGGAEVEGAAADRRGVDQLADHLGDRPHRAAAEAVGPEHPRDVGVAPTAHGAGSRPSPRSATNALAGLDLDHAADRHVAHRRLAVAERRERHRHAGGLEARPSPAGCRRSDRRPGPTRRARRARPARGPPSRRRRSGARSARNRSRNASASLVDREGDVAARARAARARARRAAPSSRGARSSRSAVASSDRTTLASTVGALAAAAAARPASRRRSASCRRG